MSSSEEIRRVILELLAQRKSRATICPSEAARARWPEDWRGEMARVREVAVEMARRGELEICQGGEAVDPGAYRGPIRLRLPVPPER